MKIVKVHWNGVMTKKCFPEDNNAFKEFFCESGMVYLKSGSTYLELFCDKKLLSQIHSYSYNISVITNLPCRGFSTELKGGLK